MVAKGKINGFAPDDLDAAIVHAGDVWAQLKAARLFVTGGTGFFGQWIVSVLLRACDTQNLGLTLCVLTRDAAKFSVKSSFVAAHPAVTLVEGDVRDFQFPSGTFSHIIHAATDTSQAADSSPDLLIDTIINGTRRVLAFAKASGARKLVLTSSGAVYGPQPAGLAQVPESYVGAPLPTHHGSTYGQAKRMAEQLCVNFAQTNGADCMIARCFAFVGPGMEMRGHFAIGNFIADAVEGQAIHIKGDGTPLRSFLYAGDMVAWLLRILVHGKAGAAYNVGSDTAISIGELARNVAAIVAPNISVTIAGQAGADRSDRSVYVPSIELARNDLGLKVWTDLNRAIANTAAWVKT